MEEQLPLQSIAKMIDHSLLHPTLTDEEIGQGCELAKKYDVATVCVKPYSIPLVKDFLADSQVKICSVIAFPHGNSVTGMKIRETKTALMAGAQEIDMVINIGKVLSGEWDYVFQEIKALNETVTASRALLKVIFENDFLQDDHIKKLCEICSTHKVAFVKTSSGYGFVKQENGMYSYRGATDAHLKLMREYCHNEVQIKAAGGIRSLEDVLRVNKLGATRIGTSATETILKERSETKRK